MLKIEHNVKKIHWMVLADCELQKTRLVNLNLKKLSELNWREGKHNEENEQMIDNLLNNSTQCNIHGFGVPEGQNRMEEEMYFKILVKKFSQFHENHQPIGPKK